MNLIEGLQKEMNRCRELLKVYDEIPAGDFAASVIRFEIKLAEKSIAEEDTLGMMKYYKSLKNIE